MCYALSTVHNEGLLPELSGHFDTCQLCLHLFLTLCFWTSTAAVLPSLHSVCPSSMRAGATSLTKLLVIPSFGSAKDLPVPRFSLSLFDATVSGEATFSGEATNFVVPCEAASLGEATVSGEPTNFVVPSEAAPVPGEAPVSGEATNLVVPGETTVSGEATISGEATYWPRLLLCYL